MRIERLGNNKIYVEIPLTTQSGKIRVKIRNSFYEYGIPTATRQIPFSQKHYIEWQIGYDVDKGDKEKLALSTLQNTHFVGANKKNKALYELSEYLYYFVQWGIINKTEIENLCTFLQKLKNDDFIDSREDLQIFRSYPKQKQILDMEFYVSEVKYPLLVHKFGNFDVLVEIIIKEKQRAIGAQPMLYVCFPITELESKNDITFLGRVARTKECGLLSLNASHKAFVLECFKIFGILSKNHNYDVLEILKVIKDG
ncbi:R.Pab1 family restriction endonuclease [Campylobacter sp. MIT 97-5078]|uniref:R.Pab1 family restriction endonuclease n=1 Tax=Campylobacter sp. MIT 97-5078 TaxID=1548153 RepID=UPI000512CEF6|nr:R.Pab1 family restriction endonuclease [Campylobacter sp. MIT 97-5078]KGI55266.1 restriction endonuclease [Campylobacter sp. MIT 97-5078]TQR27312.1 R.Pab1 family restriction endonuclease [Campylobacter sp. MIT 97-5078]